MDFSLLADRKEAIPTIAGWYFDQWGRRTEGNSVEKISLELRKYLHREEIPLVVLAVEADELLAVAQLKYREMDIFPGREHWIGGVFVSPAYRGNGIGSCIAENLSKIAASLGVVTLHLQTEKLDGGLYARLGWERSEQVSYKGVEVLVMERQLGVQQTGPTRRAKARA